MSDEEAVKVIQRIADIPAVQYDENIVSRLWELDYIDQYGRHQNETINSERAAYNTRASYIAGGCGAVTLAVLTTYRSPLP